MMAKRKRRKSTKKPISYGVELTGLILLLLGVIGLGLGVVGVYLKKITIFFAGDLWFLIIAVTIMTGILMLFKRTLPDFSTNKAVGTAVLIISVIALFHFKIINNNFKDTINITYNNFFNKVSDLNQNSSIGFVGDPTVLLGGGMIGATLVFLLSSLFGLTGAKVITIIFVVFGLILSLDLHLFEMLKTFINFIRKNKKPKKVKLDEEGNVIVKPKKEEMKKEKLVITSLDEVKSKKTVTSLETSNLDLGSKSTHDKLPTFDILNKIEIKQDDDKKFVKENKDILEKVLKDFGITGKVVKIHVGPAVTQYEITVPQGTKVNRISSIHKEIALALAAKDVRIEAPIPGKSTIGIEIPNKEVALVHIREVLEDTAHINDKNKIFVALGKDIMGTSILEDITKMPHLLVAGSTGSGKSVAINSIIASILMRYKPNEVKLVLIDPKKVELTNYTGIPHLLTPVVTDPKHASGVLQNIVREMEERYQTFSDKQYKNIAAYNDYIDRHNQKKPEDPQQRMPHIIVIIDELADLMLVASKEVEESIMRITQIARAAGIHLIVATQRPSTDVITGLIKNNIPSRMAFSVASQIDSRTILDMGGAERLIGRGDMLYLPMDQNTPKRIQGCFISDGEINKLIKHWKDDNTKYDDRFSKSTIEKKAITTQEEDYEDPMYNEVVEFAIENKSLSTSLIQRRFRFGYNRAARIIDLLEERGIVGPQQGSKPRDVLVELESNEEEEE